MAIKIPKFNLKSISVGLVFLLLFIAAVFFGYQYFQNQKKEAAVGDNDQVIAKVSGLVLLPDGETPTIATVSDVTKLRSQPFFAAAENGDKVLIYQNAKKAVLYRPSIDRIIEIGPVGEGTSVASGGDQPEQESEPFKVAIMNGTSTAGLAAKMDTTIKGKDLNLEVLSLGNAVGKDYEDTVVVALSQNQDENAKRLADSIGASVGDVPREEDFGDLGADVVVIVGTDAI